MGCEKNYCRTNKISSEKDTWGRWTAWSERDVIGPVLDTPLIRSSVAVLLTEGRGFLVGFPIENLLLSLPKSQKFRSGAVYAKVKTVK